jgi:FtsP/CotA-like multicopper oxidase with cupredoxin domain
LIVEGIAKLKPDVADLPERILILRDQTATVGRTLRDSSDDRAEPAGKDISLNFVPVIYPLYIPAVIRVAPDRREFWRVLNASADTYFTLAVQSVVGGQRIAQNLELIAMDGAPVSRETTAAARTSIIVSPGGRAEFVVKTPQAGTISRLISSGYDTGPDGARNPGRVIANIVAATGQPDTDPAIMLQRAHGTSWHFTGLTGLRPAGLRKLYFSEDTGAPGSPAKYFITVEGKTPAVFNMNFRKPDLSVRQGTVEDWIIENRTHESHVFHIHQIHFQLMGREGIAVNEPMLRDTIDLPYWDGESPHYPNVKLRMDFRAPQIVGTFLFHCHILEHEDGGMMGSVEVVKAR